MWISIHARSMSVCVYQYFQSGRPGPTWHLQVLPTITKEMYRAVGDPHRDYAISMGLHPNKNAGESGYIGYILPSFRDMSSQQPENGEPTPLKMGDVKFRCFLFPPVSSHEVNNQWSSHS